jgi:hypothetical protein
MDNENLTSIHRNAFGFSDNSTDETRKIRQITIYESPIETFDKNLLPWNKLDLINIRNTPANCNPAVRFNYIFK